MLETMTDRWHAAMLDLLREVNRTQPDHYPQLVNAATEPLGVHVTIYLVDYEQLALRPLTPGEEPEPVNGSIAGQAYRLGVVESQIGPISRHTTTWIPLLDGTERLGVLRMAADDDTGEASTAQRDSYLAFAGLVGHLIAARLPYTDRLQRARRGQPMSVASELLRQMLPPSTFTTDRFAIAADLQPPYTVGADAFDYAVDGDTAYLAIFDGMGHGLEAGLTTAVALAATRKSRRDGESIYTMAHTADGHLAAHFPGDQFVTAFLGRLDLVTGQLQYLSAGHPPPLLLHGRESTMLDGGRRTPLGITDTAISGGIAELQPGDRLLLYTDGITDSRDPAGRPFGPHLLAEMAAKGTAEPLPETARRITRAVLDHHRDLPADDATVVLLEWSTHAADVTLP